MKETTIEKINRITNEYAKTEADKQILKLELETLIIQVLKLELETLIIQAQLEQIQK